jgi:hypothetical protein
MHQPDAAYDLRTVSERSEHTPCVNLISHAPASLQPEAADTKKTDAERGEAITAARPIRGVLRYETWNDRSRLICVRVWRRSERLVRVVPVRRARCGMWLASRARACSMENARSGLLPALT